MLIFQLLFIFILLVELGMGLAVKYNYNGLQDKLVNWFMVHNIEDYIRYQFPDKWIFQMLFILVLFILSII